MPDASEQQHHRRRQRLSRIVFDAMTDQLIYKAQARTVLVALSKRLPGLFAVDGPDLPRGGRLSINNQPTALGNSLAKVRAAIRLLSAIAEDEQTPAGNEWMANADLLLEQLNRIEGEIVIRHGGSTGEGAARYEPISLNLTVLNMLSQEGVQGDTASRVLYRLYRLRPDVFASVDITPDTDVYE